MMASCSSGRSGSLVFELLQPAFNLHRKVKGTLNMVQVNSENLKYLRRLLENILRGIGIPLKKR